MSVNNNVGFSSISKIDSSDTVNKISTIKNEIASNSAILGKTNEDSLAEFETQDENENSLENWLNQAWVSVGETEDGKMALTITGTGDIPNKIASVFYDKSLDRESYFNNVSTIAGHIGATPAYSKKTDDAEIEDSLENPFIKPDETEEQEEKTESNSINDLLTGIYASISEGDDGKTQLVVKGDKENVQSINSIIYGKNIYPDEERVSILKTLVDMALEK